MSESYLLDTCAVIWMTQNELLAARAADAVSDSKAMGIPVYVSTATAWEMAMLVARGRIHETRDAKRWYDSFRQETEVAEKSVTADLFMASCILPQPIHKDPIDRILIATAREHDLTIITRDRAILSYGAAGHVRTLAC
ncbi:PilT protein-like protein [Neorhizobium galegae bv. officinalis]|jgi:PIN domain nuclease of toxin-antitoxin system|uniref:PilT protein-like protein n=1 Tax=Neorhizobium galegae bv. officinalis TaxID=323656 RepID=A0A0T7FNY4_NEOGA|nr:MULTISPECIES: type II toxin-antitoxin system VapC family toxin [Neorhizobium]CDZ36708.1 PilT protein-like protein [Neorhizobium galegae bv. officinalis]